MKKILGIKVSYFIEKLNTHKTISLPIIELVLSVVLWCLFLFFIVFGVLDVILGRKKSYNLQKLQNDTN